MESLKKNYRRTFELSILIVLTLMHLTFLGFRFISIEIKTVEAKPKPPVVLEIPPTDFPHKPSEPPRPTVPIASPNPDLPDDATIPPNTKIDLVNIPPAPKLEIDEIADFFAVDKKPVPIGGYEQINRHLIYPEMARKVGIEGRTFVKILISKGGNILSAKIYKSSGSLILDDAALLAIFKTRWEPAYQRDMPVNVRVVVPVDFKLR